MICTCKGYGPNRWHACYKHRCLTPDLGPECPLKEKK